MDNSWNSNYNPQGFYWINGNNSQHKINRNSSIVYSNYWKEKKPANRHTSWNINFQLILKRKQFTINNLSCVTTKNIRFFNGSSETLARFDVPHCVRNDTSNERTYVIQPWSYECNLDLNQSAWFLRFHCVSCVAAAAFTWFTACMCGSCSTLYVLCVLNERFFFVLLWMRGCRWCN